MSWQDVKRGDDPPRVVNVVVETPFGSRLKYALGKEHGLMTVSKLLSPGCAFPANTGFFAACWERTATRWMPWWSAVRRWRPAPCVQPAQSPSCA